MIFNLGAVMRRYIKLDIKNHTTCGGTRFILTYEPEKDTKLITRFYIEELQDVKPEEIVQLTIDYVNTLIGDVYDIKCT